jgi:dolichol-phosphate mannosyltransferase
MGFAIVGALGTVISTSVLYFFTEFIGLYYVLSSLISAEMSTIFNFALNDTFVFQERTGSIWKKLVSYHIVSAVGTVLTIILMIIFTEIFKVHYIFSQVIAICIMFVFNFIINRRYTWHAKDETP